MQEVTHLFQNITDTIGILQTNWSKHYTVKDIEELQGHVQEAMQEARKIFGQATYEFSVGRSGQIQHSHQSYSMKQAKYSPEEQALQDSINAPKIIATTNEDILSAPIGAVIDAPIELWEALGMDVADDPDSYPLPEDL